MALEFPVSVQRTYIQNVSHANADYHYILGLAFLEKSSYEQYFNFTDHISYFIPVEYTVLKEFDR